MTQKSNTFPLISFIKWEYVFIACCAAPKWQKKIINAGLRIYLVPRTLVGLDMCTYSLIISVRPYSDCLLWRWAQCSFVILLNAASLCATGLPTQMVLAKKPSVIWQKIWNRLNFCHSTINIIWQDGAVAYQMHANIHSWCFTLCGECLRVL